MPVKACHTCRYKNLNYKKQPCRGCTDGAVAENMYPLWEKKDGE